MPAAIVLWSWFHIDQQHEHDAMLRESDRHDLAGLVAIAMHEPKELKTVRTKFLNRVLDTTADDAAAVQRALDHVTRHVQLRPIEITEQPT